MEKLKPKYCIILHPQWASELPDTFGVFVRADRYLDCTAYQTDPLYIRVEAIEQRLGITTVTLLLPHRFVSAIVNDVQNIVGFAPQANDTAKGIR